MKGLLAGFGAGTGAVLGVLGVSALVAVLPKVDPAGIDAVEQAAGSQPGDVGSPTPDGNASGDFGAAMAPSQPDAAKLAPVAAEIEPETAEAETAANLGADSLVVEDAPVGEVAATLTEPAYGDSPPSALAEVPARPTPDRTGSDGSEVVQVDAGDRDVASERPDGGKLLPTPLQKPEALPVPSSISVMIAPPAAVQAPATPRIESLGATIAGEGVVAVDAPMPEDDRIASAMALPRAEEPDAGGVLNRDPVPAPRTVELAELLPPEPPQTVGPGIPDTPQPDAVSGQGRSRGDTSTMTAPLPAGAGAPGGDPVPLLSAAPSGPAPREVPNTTELADSAVEAVDDMSDQPALARNAVPADPTGGRPLMAVILVDLPGGALIDSIPLSVAIPADQPDAAARAATWRAAGQEIIAIPAFPNGRGGGPEKLISATVEALSTAVAVMAEDPDGFSGGPVAAATIADALAETGHGLIVRGEGLDPAIRSAERVGVPNAQVYRRIDGEGRDARAITRFLDQAAFEARLRGAVIVLAENTPDTAAAFDRWLTSSRAGSVALVPVSTILLADGS